MGWGQVGGKGHITLCWGWRGTLGSQDFLGGGVEFTVESKWVNGNGYNLNASRSVPHCIDVQKFPQRNDGGYPGSTEWWHCSGGNLDALVGTGEKIPGTFDASTLVIS